MPDQYGFARRVAKGRPEGELFSISWKAYLEESLNNMTFSRALELMSIFSDKNSGDDLAKTLGVSKMWISKLLNGKNKPNEDLMKKILKEFDCQNEKEFYTKAKTVAQQYIDMIDRGEQKNPSDPSKVTRSSKSSSGQIR